MTKTKLRIVYIHSFRWGNIKQMVVSNLDYIQKIAGKWQARQVRTNSQPGQQLGTDCPLDPQTVLGMSCKLMKKSRRRHQS